ncbi:hypothetical protein O9993_08770 [Vibrio lentus]|nr:hypothetical protein [Vibrio lentus]
MWRFEFDGAFLDVNLEAKPYRKQRARKVAVRSGYGIAMLPRQLAQEIYPESGEMVEILPQYALKDRTVHALTESE